MGESLAAGEAGDRVLYYGSAAPLQRDNYLKPIPQSLRDDLSLDERFYEASLANRYYDGDLYGIPMELNAESPGFLVNRRVFEDRGVDVPESWDRNMGPSGIARSSPTTSSYGYYNLSPLVEVSPPYSLSEGGWGLVISDKTEKGEALMKFISFLPDGENLAFWSETVGAVPPPKNLDPSAFSLESAPSWLVPTLAVLPCGRDPGAFSGDTYTLVWNILRRNLRS